MVVAGAGQVGAEPTGGEGGHGSVGRFLAALLAGVATLALGVALWVVLNLNIGQGMAFVAVFVGAAIAVAVVLTNGRRSWPATLAVIALTVLAAVLSQNFLERAQLQDGIDQLQGLWSDLRVEVTEGPATASGTDEYNRPAGCTVAPDVVPPPAIVKVLPLAAYECFTPEVLAIVYDAVPPEIKPQIHPELRRATEAIIAEQDLKAARSREKGSLERARARFERTDYHIPQAVLACAPPPDFTQSTAAAGLGFPDGVPWFLPLSDLVDGSIKRGDGLEYNRPSPFCFASENAQDEPFETLSWVAALVAAVVVSRLVGRRRRIPESLPQE